MYGSYGVAVGMFVYGMCLQLYMNWAGGDRPERGLFIYISMLIPLINLEEDTISLIAGVIQLGLVVVLTSYVIYGTSASSLRVAKYSELKTS